MKGDAGRDRRVFDRAPAEDVEREIRFHLDMRASELMATGVPEAEARREAERAFGDVERWRRESRAEEARNRRSRRRAQVLDGIAQDVRVGTRGLLRRPVFVAVAVATLALGVGANSAVFALMDRVLFHPLPYPDAESLVSVWQVADDGRPMHVAAADFVDWEAGSRSFTALAAHTSATWGHSYTILGGSEPVRRHVAAVSPGFFEAMGLGPASGRVFEAGEFGGLPRVAVVSRRFWRQFAGSQADLPALSLNIEGVDLQVIGVMPAGFAYPDGTDVWIPLDLADGSTRSSHNYEVIGRLRPDGTVAEAAADLDAVQARIREEHAEDADAVATRVTPLRDELYGATVRPLQLLMGAALLVLLAACANLAGAWLARSSGRDQEIALRASLGATRGRLVRQLLTEGALVGLAGAVAGVGVAALTLRMSLSLRPAPLADLGALPIDGRLLAFALALAASATLAFSVHPALRLSRARTGTALRVRARSGRGHPLAVLVAVEVAAAFTLLCGSVLLLRGLAQLIDRDLGFRTRDVLTASLSLPDAAFPDDTAVSAFYDRLLPELAAIPGVRDVGLVNNVPLGGHSVGGAFEIEGRGEDAGYAAYRVASEGYFRTLSIPVLRGRSFRAGDRIGSPTVALVNVALAGRFFPGEPAVGKRIRRLRNDSWHYPADEWLTIIGVVGDVRHDGPLSEPVPEIYVHYRQRAFRADDAVLVVRGDGPVARDRDALRQRIRDTGANIPVDIGSMDQLRNAALAEQRFAIILIGSFALIATLLVATGIHGVVTQAVESRTHEMGIRLALGASPAHVLGDTLNSTLLALAAGIGGGAILTLTLHRLLQGMLFGLTAVDVRTLLVGASALSLAAAFAALGPALRTVRLDPTSSLRSN